MTDANITADPDQVAWIERQPRQLTYTELAGRCLDHFGPDRAWTVDHIRTYWQSAHQTMARLPIERDGELLAFLQDRVGRATVDEMLAQCRARFTPDRVPSRSAIGRWLSRERTRCAR
jgi:hypothetical protein